MALAEAPGSASRAQVSGGEDVGSQFAVQHPAGWTVSFTISEMKWQVPWTALPCKPLGWRDRVRALTGLIRINLLICDT